MRILTRITLALLALSASTVRVNAQGAVLSTGGSADSRPTVAVMYFTNGATVNHSDFDPLSKGIADMLITELSNNDKIRVVERDQLQSLVKEQDLDTSSRVDAATAVRVGKLLGAQHMIFGGFVTDTKGHMRLDARAVNVETSEIEHVESVSDKSDNLLDMISTLATKMNSGLHLPPMPTHTSASVHAPDTTVVAQNVSQPGNRYKALLLYSRALVEEDKGNSKQALALYQQFLSSTPTQFATAQRAQAEDKVKHLSAQGG